MKKILNVLFIAFFVFFFSNCKKDTIEYDTLKLSIEQQQVSGLEGKLSLKVEANGAWTVSSNQDWCLPKALVGSGNDSLTITYTPNETGNNRTAIITISGGSLTKTLSIEQTPVFGIDKSGLAFSAWGGRSSFYVTAVGSWKLVSDQTWCSVSDTIGDGDKTVAIYCLRNNTTAARTANLSIVGLGYTKTVSITQNSGTIWFNDNFDNNNHNWMIVSSPNPLDTARVIANGYYSLKNCKSIFGQSVIDVLSDLSRDFIVECSVSMVSGNNGFGLIFGESNISNFYSFNINTSGAQYELSKRTSGNLTTLAANSASFMSNSNYKIKIVKTGTNYDFYINDSLVINSTITSLYGRYFGFKISPLTEVAIDYLTVIQF